jgi:hypothetical protein
MAALVGLLLILTGMPFYLTWKAKMVTRDGNRRC